MCENQPSGVQLRAVVGGELLVAEVMKRQTLIDVVACQGLQEVFFSTFGKKSALVPLVPTAITFWESLTLR